MHPDQAGAKESSHSKAGVAALTLGALGIVYGDIGTSPLYSLRETFHHQHLEVSQGNVLGVLSLIFWSLVSIICIKYLLFVMRADNEGEGGILALTSLLPQVRNGERGFRWGLLLLGLFGTALLYGDGAITPAISVLAAVEGTTVAAPGLAPFVIPIACAILFALFFIQRKGTATVGKLFGPVMLVWFATIAVLGLLQLVSEPSVLRSINPMHGVRFFADNGFPAFLSLGSVFLVVTGGEALYADMGHFGRRPIVFGWFGLAFPALLLNYLGQGALLLRNPEAIESPFYNLAPSWAVLGLVVLATFATVIASQALISGLFSLTLQAVSMDYAPRVDIDHTSPTAFGQIYIPTVNWGLFAACIGLVVGFRSSTNLAAAYGVAVTATMVITTLLFAVVVRHKYRWSLAATIAFATPFLLLELGFFGANLFKIPEGGWFPLVVGAVIFTVLTTWHTGRDVVRRLMRRGEIPLRQYLDDLWAQPSPPGRVPGTAVYLFRDPDATPPALIANVQHHHVVHERVYIVAIKTERVPRVPPADRAELTDYGDGVCQVVIHYGFMEDQRLPQALTEGAAATLEIDFDDVTYFVAAERLHVTERPSMAPWREHLFAGIHRNATSAASFFCLPPERVMIVGLPVEI